LQGGVSTVSARGGRPSAPTATRIRGWAAVCPNCHKDPALAPAWNVGVPLPDQRLAGSAVLVAGDWFKVGEGISRGFGIDERLSDPIPGGRGRADERHRLREERRDPLGGGIPRPGQGSCPTGAPRAAFATFARTAWSDPPERLRGRLRLPARGAPTRKEVAFGSSIELRTTTDQADRKRPLHRLRGVVLESHGRGVGRAVRFLERREPRRTEVERASVRRVHDEARAAPS
jgi:hypothetical protein